MNILMWSITLLLILWCHATCGKDAASIDPSQVVRQDMDKVRNATGTISFVTPHHGLHVDTTGGLSLPWPSPCRIKSMDSFTNNQIKDILSRHTKLVNYKLVFPNYTFNPLRTNTTWSYQADGWSRVSNLHGQTLLTLAFNYGVMSLMTLTFGVESMSVNLTDIPDGCFGELDEEVKIKTLRHLMMKDFKDYGPFTFKGDERVCHEVIEDEDGFAKFRNRCCFIDTVHEKLDCKTSLRNIWLTVIYWLLGFVRFSVLFCGPLFFVSIVLENATENVPYVVKLKEPLKKKLFLCRGDTPVDVTYRRELDLRHERGYHKLRESATNMPLGQIIEAEIPQYDILVNYRKLLPENSVPVGLLQCLGRAIFMCKMKGLDACNPCCESNMLQPYKNKEYLPWSSVCNHVGRILMVMLLPTPLYFRLAIFYLFEEKEVMERRIAIKNMGLFQTFENSLLHYLGPTHPLFLLIYTICMVAAMVVTYFAISRGAYFKSVIVNAFKDLKRMSWLKALEISVINMLWPFRRYGVMGCVVGLLYWPIALVVCLVVWTVYILPTFYLTFRMLHHTRQSVIGSHKKRKAKYRVERNADRTMSLFEMENLKKRFCPKDDSGIKEWHDDEYTPLQRQRAKGIRTSGTNKREVLEHTLVVILLILAMYGILILLSECLGFLVEVLVFTLMGIILNAGSMLKFISLIFLVIVYSFDCYNNVNKKYLKMNKSLFVEIKDRIKDLKDVTSLPSHLQENFGFKSVECSEQKDYEKPDDIAKDAARHWMINDLILFIDNEDMPRIPRQLFDEVCKITVAGSPGPVYSSLLKATNDFIKIICFLFFVFLIVLSFGAVYQVNATNQSLATMAGGFLPLILRSFMAPKKPDIELGTLSFKSKLDEIIQNFYQNWPIFDFPFKEPEEESEDEDSSGNESDDGKEDGAKKKKRKSSCDDGKDKNKKEKDKKDKDKGKKDKDKKDKDKKSKDKKSVGKNEPDADSKDRLHVVQIDVLDGISRTRSFRALEIEGEEESEEGEYDVDILVNLPDVTLEWWLEEWSDIGEYEDVLPMKPMPPINNNVV